MTMQITALRVEHRRDGFGLGTATPRLSWTVDGGPGVQAWAELEADRSGGTEVTRVDGPDQVLVAWPFAPLASRERVVVRVRVAADDGTVSPWSDPLVVEASLLDRAGSRLRVGAPRQRVRSRRDGVDARRRPLRAHARRPLRGVRRRPAPRRCDARVGAGDHAWTAVVTDSATTAPDETR